MDIINKILELLNRKNKTQKDLTDFLGLSKYIFSDWKSGKNSSYLKYISQIAVFLDVSTDYLLGNDDKKTSLPSENDKLDLVLNKLSKENLLKVLEFAEFLEEKEKQQNQ